jgi:glycosyltransferase involved in cell wall biosynthesis
MRILLLSQWFDPEPAFKGLVFAKALQKAGNDVEVLTGFPNYPGGVVYPNYRIRWMQREVMDGIRVERVPLYPSHDSSAVGRAFNYMSFAVSSCLYGCLRAGRADIMYVYHPPLTTALSAAVISMVRGVPFVVDVNDLWPESLAATGMVRNERLLALVGRMCLWVYRRAARVVVGTPGIRDRLIERGVPAEKIEVIYNWSDEQALRLPVQTLSADVGMADRFNVVFAGNMGKAQALDAVLRAAKRVESVDPRIQFVFVGGGVELDNLKTLALELQAANVRFLPRMPMSEVGSVLNAADVLLVHLRDEPLFEITLPSKTQAYMSVGKPVLMGVRGDAASLIERAGAGRLAEPEDDASIAAAVLDLARLPAAELTAMGQRGAAYYSSHLSLESGTKRFLALFQRVLGSPGAPGAGAPS